MSLGRPELILILIIVFFLFGAKRLPEMGKEIGKGIRDLKEEADRHPELLYFAAAVALTAWALLAWLTHITK